LFGCFSSQQCVFLLFFLKKLLLCLYKRLLACFSCPTVRIFAVFFEKTFAVAFINVCLAALVPDGAFFCCFF